MSATLSIKNVTACGVCPFASDGEAFDGQWSCHAEYTKEGWPRDLGGTHPPKAPPKWCPLRDKPILIKLKLPTRRKS